MILPGMNYQDAAWGKIKKALGKAAMGAMQEVGPHRLANDPLFMSQHQMAIWVAIEDHLQREIVRTFLERDIFNCWRKNGYELALELVEALNGLSEEGQSNCPKYFIRLIDQLQNCKAGAEDDLRKIANNVFSELRDAVDIQGFEAATGEPMSTYKLLCLRWVEGWASEVTRIIQCWSTQPEYASLILGYAVSAEPIEARQLRNGQRCKAKWLLAWSEHYGQFHEGKIGPIHKLTGKKFARTEENIDNLLWELDPIKGRFAELLKYSNADLDAASRALTRMKKQVVSDDHHESRVQKPRKPEPDNNDMEVFNSEVQEDNENADGSDNEEAPLSETVADGQEGASASPGNHWVYSTPTSNDVEAQNSDPETHDESLLARSTCFEIFPLPIQVGIMRDLTARERHPWLVRTLNELGVFNEWAIPRSVDKLTNAELARRLSLVEQETVSPYILQQRLKQARQDFLDCAAKHLANAGDEENT